MLPARIPAMPCKPVAEGVAVEPAVVEAGDVADLVAVADEPSMRKPSMAASMVAVREPVHWREVATGDGAPDETMAPEPMEAGAAEVAERTVAEAHAAEVAAATQTAALKTAKAAPVEAAEAAKAAAAKSPAMEAATATKAATSTSGKRFRRQQRQDQCRGRYEYRNPAHGDASSKGQART